jgi:S-disulfanyl-L-cysteine oxidoreductase SoxD
MKNLTINWIAVCAVLTAAWALEVALLSQAATTGVYTEDQAKRGAALYKELCGTCHGDDLLGSGGMPALSGEAFASSWQGKTLGDLFERIGTTMPALDPGSLRPAQTVDLIAYMLSISKYPAGATELASSPDALRRIKIEAVR